MGGDSHAAAEQRHRLRREPGCCQKQLSTTTVGPALAPPRRAGEPEVELSVGAAQAFKTAVVDEIGDVGLAEGPGFIGEASGAEVQDSVHTDVPFHSFLVVCGGSARLALLLELPMRQLG